MVEAQEVRPKPRGFGNPAMKTATATLPPKKMQLADDGITAEEAEKARKTRLASARSGETGEGSTDKLASYSCTTGEPSTNTIVSM